MTLGEHVPLTHRGAWLGIVVLLLLLLPVGCSSTRTVTVPASEPTVQRGVPDTLKLPELPPLEARGQLTRPEEVIVYSDTAEYTVDLSWLKVDPQGETVTVRTQNDSQTVEREFQMPTFGERLRLRAGSTGLQGTVFGTPTERQVQATVESIQLPWWRRTVNQIRLALAFFGGMAFGYVFTKLTPA